MHEGFDRDDIYIMVEDEFYAVAKTFTQHLHHAEYMRLKTLAKSRNASASNAISRPVDSITAMRTETKKRKQADARDARNVAALEQLKHPAAQAPRQNSESDLSDLENEAKDGGHWKGTALQGLMSPGPRKNLNSLIGLQGVKSSTRAAAGYSKAENRPVHRTSRTFDLDPNSRPKMSKQRLLSEASTSDESETDDLDAPVVKRQVAATRPPSKPVNKSIEDTSYRRAPAPSRVLSTKTLQGNPNILPSSLPRPTKKTFRSPPHASDSNSDSEPRPSILQSDAARRRLKARLAREELDKRKNERGSVDEIPIFLT